MRSKRGTGRPPLEVQRAGQAFVATWGTSLSEKSILFSIVTIRLQWVNEERAEDVVAFYAVHTELLITMFEFSVMDAAKAKWVPPLLDGIWGSSGGL